MALAVIGFNHNNTPLAVREQLVFDANQLSSEATELFKLLSSQLQQELRGLVIVSTCNRTEFYLDSDTEVQQEIVLQWLQATKTVDQQQLQQYYYAHYRNDAVAHLFAVISGLDSMVTGETQIAGQIKFAYQVCLLYTSDAADD